MTQGKSSVSERRTVFILFLILFCLFNANLTEMGSGDTNSTVFTAWSLVEDGSIAVDRFVPDLVSTAHDYSVSKREGRWISNYPLLPAFLTLPAMYLFDRLGILYDRTALDAAKLTASVLTALSAVFLYLAMRSRVGRRRALLFALLYGAATSTWSTTSQAMWQHTASQFFFSWAIMLMVLREEERRMLKWAGLAVALAVAGRLANVSIALVILAYVILRYRADSWRFLPFPLVVGGALLAYNLGTFGHWQGGYAELNGPKVFAYFHWMEIPHNLAAILISPNRGLFIFSPVLIFAVAGVVAIFKEKRPKGPYPMFVAVCVVFLFQIASYGWWWGGHCYGPKILVDILPFLCMFLVFLPESPRLPRLGRAVFIILFTLSVFVQYVGAFHYPNGLWNPYPVNVDQDHSRVWDLSDAQIMRELSAPPHSRAARVLLRALGVPEKKLEKI